MTLFEDFSEADARLVLSFFTGRGYQANDMLVRRGERGDSLFLVQAGRVVVKVDRKIVGEYGPGEVFGEICLAGGGLRTASVFAVEPVRALVLDSRSLGTLIAVQPGLASLLLLNLIKMLGAKLRAADEALERQIAADRGRASAPGKASQRGLVGLLRARFS